MTVVLFILILAILVFVHELGHFTMAKLFGIRVDEFAIGFPPRIFSCQKGETKYCLNLIPFGGYVKIFGENPDDESMNGKDSARSFVNASKWKQIIILLAGILMNIIFAWILISASFNIGLLTSIDNQYKDKAEDVSVMILSVLEGSPSELAGLKEGDRILSIESNSIVKIIPNVEEVQEAISSSDGNIKIQYQRGDTINLTEVAAKNGVVNGKKAIGISMGLVGTVKYGFFQSLYEGAKLTWFETKSITLGIYKFIIEVIRGDNGVLSNVTGPIGIAGMVGQAKNIGISYLLGFIAMISINLAGLNSIPFPALDGGRALFVLIETVIRKRIKPVILNWANLIGFVILIALMIFVTYKDILKLF